MSLSSKITRVLSGRRLIAKVREDRRRATQKEWRRRRLFEALEPRQMLDAASLSALPDEITISAANSYHYAFEGQPNGFIDSSTVEGLTASFVNGEQVAFTVLKTSTDGAVSSLGEVVIQLFNSEGEAPNSSSQFMSLVFDDYYEGKTFHRVIDGFMFQGGSSDGYGYQGSDLANVPDEYSDVLTHSTRGIVAYANSNDPQHGRVDTSNAQFYITFGPTPWLDGGYNVFGFVVDGYDVLDQMEHVAVTNNPMSGEQSFPVETYSISNCYIIPQEAATQGALRLVADENASGVTTVSFSSNTAEDALQYQETKVYVGADGFSAYVQEKIDALTLELVAGETKTVTLPSEFGGEEIQYTVTKASGAQGYSIVSKNGNNFEFDIVSTEAGAQFTTISITAKTDGGLTATAAKQVFISPSKPEAVFVSTDETTVGTLAEGFSLISSNFFDSPVQINVSFKTLEKDPLTQAPIEVYVDGTQYAYAVEEHAYDEETQTAVYALSLSLSEADKLDDGPHTVKVRNYLAVEQVTDHERLYSEDVLLNFVVDTKDLTITNSADPINVNVGDAGVLQILTNKADESGVNREDITFAPVNPNAVPRFVSISADGALSWGAITSEDYGTFQFEIQAEDGLKNTAKKSFTINVGSKPVFDDLTEELTVVTGEILLATVTARVPTDSTALVRYSVAGPEGMTISPSTGAIVWAVDGDYITDVRVKSQKRDFAVTATAYEVAEDGTATDLESTTKTFSVTVNNSKYQPESTVTPVWDPIAPQTVTAGDTFRLTVHAKAEASAAASAAVTENDGEISPGSDTEQEDLEVGVLYELTGTVPSGMTIGASTGAITWAVPADYFSDNSIKSKTITVALKATAILSEVGSSVEYGGSAETSFPLTVTNPNYTDSKPVFTDLTNVTAATNSLYQGKVVATDPDGRADRIAYELVGSNYPAEFVFNGETGEISWRISEHYLDDEVSAQIFKFTVKATEQFREEDGTYTDGLADEKTFEIMVANAGYDASKAIVPVFDPIAAQTAESGKTFTLTVVAKATETVPASGSEASPATVTYPVEYSLSGEYPEGMIIDSETGAITWDVPEDYFSSDAIESKELAVSVTATTVFNETSDFVDYSGKATSTFNLTVKNSNYKSSDFADWREWFDGWVANAQTRYNGQAANLKVYLKSYLDAIDDRTAKLKAAKADYASGKSTVTDFIAARDVIVSDFNKAVAEARTKLEEDDAKFDEAYDKQVEVLNQAYKTLSENAELTKPKNIDKDVRKAANKAIETAIDRSTGNANFRLAKKSTGARVATNLTTALKLWREGYAYNTAYDDAYSDKLFVDALADENANAPASDSGSSTNSGSTANSGTSTESGASTSIDPNVAYTVDENGNLVPVTL
ncbi:MAG: peptidylprolyl isomerase [Thermoguttaceae bacterium]|nr:peptidylprolyl isomerase [Thermoguttaceae bacterium]